MTANKHPKTIRTKEERSRLRRNIIGAILLFTLLGSIVFVVVNIFTAPSAPPADDPYAKVKSDYTLMLVQCILACVVMFIPTILHKKWSVEIPNYMYIMYYVFLYCAVYLGEVRSFYYTVERWDVMLHTFSGAMLGALGFSLVSLLNEDKRVPMEMSPFFIALFAFCFALACGVVWEIYEFTLDGIMQLNMQKYALQDGTLIVGRAALLDTMEDLIVDTLGALAVCVVGYISLKKSRAKKKKAEAEEKNERDLPLDEGRGTVVN